MKVHQAAIDPKGNHSWALSDQTDLPWELLPGVPLPRGGSTTGGSSTGGSTTTGGSSTGGSSTGGSSTGGSSTGGSTTTGGFLYRWFSTDIQQSCELVDRSIAAGSWSNSCTCGSLSNPWSSASSFRSAMNAGSISGANCAKRSGFATTRVIVWGFKRG